MDTSNFYYIPYQVVAASSQSPDSRVEELSNNSRRVMDRPVVIRNGGWENARYCQWPQEIILRLEERTQLQHILIASKENRSIPYCDFYSGDGVSGSFNECVYRHSGSGYDIIDENPR
jgi:hypothetical protein